MFLSLLNSTELISFLCIKLIFTDTKKYSYIGKMILLFSSVILATTKANTRTKHLKNSCILLFIMEFMYSW